MGFVVSLIAECPSPAPADDAEIQAIAVGMIAGTESRHGEIV